MTRTPIPNCPQEDKPIRDRAWTEGQKLARLRELAERCRCWRRTGRCSVYGLPSSMWSDGGLTVKVTRRTTRLDFSGTGRRSR